jgi:hypothetical protein
LRRLESMGRQYRTSRAGMGFNRACSFAGGVTSLIRSVQRRSRCSLRSFRYFCQAPANAAPVERTANSIIEIELAVAIDYVLMHRLM